MKTKIIILLVLFILLCIFICTKTSWNLIHENKVIRGVIYDHETNIPIKDAKVVLRVFDRHLLDFIDVNTSFYIYKTNKDGEYKFNSYRGKVDCVFAVHNEYYPNANDFSNGDIYLNRRVLSRKHTNENIVNLSFVDLTNNADVGFDFSNGKIAPVHSADIVFILSDGGKKIKITSQGEGGIINVKRPMSYEIAYMSMIKAPIKGYKKTISIESDNYYPLFYVKCKNGTNYAKLNIYGFDVIKEEKGQVNRGNINLSYTYQKDKSRDLFNIPGDLIDDKLLQELSVNKYELVN